MSALSVNNDRDVQTIQFCFDLLQRRISWVKEKKKRELKRISIPITKEVHRRSFNVWHWNERCCRAWTHTQSDGCDRRIGRWCVPSCQIREMSMKVIDQLLNRKRFLRWTSTYDQIGFLSDLQRAVSVGKTECCSTIDSRCCQRFWQAHVTKNTG